MLRDIPLMSVTRVRQFSLARVNESCLTRLKSVYAACSWSVNGPRFILPATVASTTASAIATASRSSSSSSSSSSACRLALANCSCLVHIRANCGLDLVGDFRMLVQEIFAVLASLAQLHIPVGEERAALGDDLHIHADVENVADLADAFVEHDVELGFTEGRGDLVLGDAHLHAIAHDFGIGLDALRAANIQAHRGVELQARCRRWSFRDCRT